MNQTMRELVSRAVAGAAALAIGGLAVTAAAQNESSASGEKGGDPSGAAAPADQNASRGRTIRISEEEVEATVRRPEGWVNSESASRAVVTFRATSDERAKIEVRLSTPVRPNKKDSFFNSFHSKLKTAGFVEVRESSDQEYGGKSGRETEYEGQTNDGSYRLVVWNFYSDRTAWILAGFFDAERRDLHYGAFQSVAKSLSFERTDDE